MERVATARELIGRWRARNARYQRRKIYTQPHPLSDYERQVVLEGRRGEAADLPPRERTLALASPDLQP